MRALLLAACLVLLVAVAPAAGEPQPPPGGGCHVEEEYVTGAYASGSLLDGSFQVHPGAPRPIECYY